MTSILDAAPPTKTVDEEMEKEYQTQLEGINYKLAYLLTGKPEHAQLANLHEEMMENKRAADLAKKQNIDEIFSLTTQLKKEKKSRERELDRMRKYYEKKLAAAMNIAGQAVGKVVGQAVKEATWQKSAGGQGESGRQEDEKGQERAANAEGLVNAEGLGDQAEQAQDLWNAIGAALGGGVEQEIWQAFSLKPQQPEPSFDHPNYTRSLEIIGKQEVELANLREELKNAYTSKKNPEITRLCTEFNKYERETAMKIGSLEAQLQKITDAYNFQDYELQKTRQALQESKFEKEDHVRSLHRALNELHLQTKDLQGQLQSLKSEKETLKTQLKNFREALGIEDGNNETLTNVWNGLVVELEKKKREQEKAETATQKDAVPQEHPQQDDINDNDDDDDDDEDNDEYLTDEDSDIEQH